MKKIIFKAIVLIILNVLIISCISCTKKGNWWFSIDGIDSIQQKDDADLDDGETYVIVPEDEYYHKHEYDEWIVTKEPTCIAEGTMVRYCTCGEKQEEIIKTKEHNYDEFGRCIDCGYSKQGDKETILPTSTVKVTTTPTIKPTSTPTIKVTATPTVKPTPTPTIKVTATPTIKPTPTPEPTPTIKPQFKVSDVEVGGTITFGAYEQDNDTSNGQEAIEWRVLAIENNKALVISKCVLDYQYYDNTWSENVTWETCKLRKWLNDTFFKNAFSSTEQAQIQKTMVLAEDNLEEEIDGGNDTEDRIFVLSVSEAQKYFSSDYDRRCLASAYAVSQGAGTSYSKDTTVGGYIYPWVLRTPGYFEDWVAGVYRSGKIDTTGDRCQGKHCIRPALWISLSA